MAVARASGSSGTAGVASAAGRSRSARVSCTAALLCSRRVRPRVRDAAEESVYDGPCAEEIDKSGEAMRSTLLTRDDGLCDRRCRKIRPSRRDQRTAAVGQHHQQQCHAVAVRGAQRLQNEALEGMPLAQDCYRTWKVAEMGSMWWCPSGAFRIPTFSSRWRAVSLIGACCI